MLPEFAGWLRRDPVYNNDRFALLSMGEEMLRRSFFTLRQLASALA